MRWEALVDPVE
jgi:hypothetical protein